MQTHLLYLVLTLEAYIVVFLFFFIDRYFNLQSPIYLKHSMCILLEPRKWAPVELVHLHGTKGNAT